MSYALIFSFYSEWGTEPIKLSYPFTNSSIILRAYCEPGLEKWHGGGYLQQCFQIDGIGRVRGTEHKIFLDTQLLEYPLIQGMTEYELEYTFNDELPRIELTFWEYQT